MVIYQNIADGLLYGFKWIQERVTDPAVTYAIAQNNSGKIIRNPDRMDFVTLSPEALKQTSVSAVPPVMPVSGAMTTSD